MAYYSHFWRITPEQFDNLEIEAYHAYGRYMKRWNEQQDRG